MKCSRCHSVVEGTAVIRGDNCLHVRCENAFFAARLGRTFACPECGGKGRWSEDVAKTRLYDPTEGYGGRFSPFQSIAYIDKEARSCAFCEGYGYLKTEPVPIIEPLRIVGWRK